MERLDLEMIVSGTGVPGISLELQELKNINDVGWGMCSKRDIQLDTAINPEGVLGDKNIAVANSYSKQSKS